MWGLWVQYLMERGPALPFIRKMDVIYATRGDIFQGSFVWVGKQCFNLLHSSRFETLSQFTEKVEVQGRARDSDYISYSQANF